MDIPLRKDTTSTFIDNMTLPIHRWFRYTAGFSAQWVEETVTAFLPKTFRNNHFKVLDPFAGSGTTGHAVIELNRTVINWVLLLMVMNHIR